jgi:protein O-mannosyl-transferase
MNAAKRIAIPVILFAAISLLYSPVRHHAFVNYDDPDYVTANPHVRAGLTADGVRWAFTSTHGANWFPLTWLSHMLDVELFGLDAGRHHLTSVFLHALNGVLLYLVLLRMTGAIWQAALAAVLFALHPLRVESVAWIAERKDVLCGLFWILTLAAYARYVERPAAGRYALVVLAFCAALMSKPMAVTLPIVLLLLDYWPLKRPFAIREKLPLFALSAAASLVTFLVQRGGGAVLTAGELPPATRAANAIVSYAAYLLKTLWPSDLAAFYPFRAPAAWEVAAAATALAAITAFALQRRFLLTGWLWFVVTLLPVIGLVQVGLQARADRYTYLPSIGLAMMLAWAVPRRAALLGVIACLALIVPARAYLAHWRDSGALFTHALAATSRNYVAHNNLGVFLRETGDPAAALRHFQAAVELRPAYSDAQNNVGESLLRAGRLDDAERHIRAAIDLRPSSPEAHVNLGAVLSRRGQTDAAANEYRRALDLDPANPEAYTGLGALGGPDAIELLREAIRLRPEYADAHYNLGRIYGLQDRPAEAAAEFQQVTRLRPSDAEAHYNLGTAYAALDRLGDAIDEFRDAIRLRPTYTNAHFNLGVAHALRGDCPSANTAFSEALRLDPNLHQARRALSDCAL